MRIFAQAAIGSSFPRSLKSHLRVVKEGKQLERIQWVDTDTKMCGQFVGVDQDNKLISYDRLLLKAEVPFLAKLVNLEELQEAGIEILPEQEIKELLGLSML